MIQTHLSPPVIIEKTDDIEYDELRYTTSPNKQLSNLVIMIIKLDKVFNYGSKQAGRLSIFGPSI